MTVGGWRKRCKYNFRVNEGKLLKPNNDKRKNNNFYIIPLTFIKIKVLENIIKARKFTLNAK